MDLNERIARLLEPERESDPTWVGYHWNEEYCQVEPRPFDRSIDASMRVIEGRWPLAKVELSKGKAKLTPWPDAKPVCFELGGRDSETSHALALALCAALEAEVGK